MSTDPDFQAESFLFGLNCPYCNQLVGEFKKNDVIPGCNNLMWMQIICDHVTISLVGNTNNNVPNYKFICNLDIGQGIPKASVVYPNIELYQFARKLGVNVIEDDNEIFKSQG